MSFSFSGFASGLADSGTAYFEGKQKDRKEATGAKRSLMFNANESIYNNALEIKKSNDKLKNEDKKYISFIHSIDPDISTDNMNKLLSMGTDNRKKAVTEFNFRSGQLGVTSPIKFGDFMSYVTDESDLDDTTKIDESIAASEVPAPSGAEAFYDNVGLVSDESVNDIYAEIESVMTELHGFSLEQAKEITKQGIYSVQHPPIKIDWSKDIALSSAEVSVMAYKRALEAANLTQVSQGITKGEIDLVSQALVSMEAAFGANYMAPKKDEDGELILDDEGRTIMERVPSGLLPMNPNFKSDFLNSVMYQEFAMEQMRPYIIGMVEDPDFNTKHATSFINGTFPGLYGGKVNAETITKAAIGRRS